MSSEQKRQKGSNILKQGGILAAASLIVRMIGLIYRIPMANIIGEKGNGIYSVAFEIYDIILIVSSYSLPLALSKIISGQNAKRQYRNIGKTFRLASIFALLSGGGFGLILFFGAQYIEKTFYASYTGVFIPLRILAPTIFIVAFLGVFRGFFQGKSTMMPTAISQIIEQVFNAVISIAAAYFFIKAHTGEYYESAWGAAGGTLGTCLGAASALIFLVFIYTLYRPIKIKKERRDRHRRVASTGTIYLILFGTIIPIILSQTVYQISGLIDFSLFGSILGDKGLDSVTTTSLVGAYTTKFRTITSVPIAISTAMSSSMIPSIVNSYITGEIRLVKQKLASTIKFNMMIALPCAVGLAILGQPLLRLLYPSQDYVLGGRLLLSGSIAIVFYALSNVTGGALQSIDKMRLPVIHSAISLLGHIALVMGLLKFTNFGVYALIIGNVTFPILVFIMNFMSLRKYINYRQEIFRTILVPVSASLWMGIIVAIVYYGMGLFLSSNLIRVIFSIAIGALVYFYVYLFLKGVSKEELLEFPMGYRLYKLARKIHVMN